MPTESNANRLKDFKNKGRDVEVNFLLMIVLLLS